MKINNVIIRRIAARVSSVSIIFLLLSWMGDEYFYRTMRGTITGYGDLPGLYLKIIRNRQTSPVYKNTRIPCIIESKQVNRPN